SSGAARHLSRFCVACGSRPTICSAGGVWLHGTAKQNDMGEHKLAALQVRLRVLPRGGFDVVLQPLLEWWHVAPVPAGACNEGGKVERAKGKEIAPPRQLCRSASKTTVTHYDWKKGHPFPRTIPRAPERRRIAFSVGQASPSNQ